MRKMGAGHFLHSISEGLKCQCISSSNWYSFWVLPQNETGQRIYWPQDTRPTGLLPFREDLGGTISSTRNEYIRSGSRDANK